MEKSVGFTIVGHSITKFGKSFWFSDIGKPTDLPISEMWMTDIGNLCWFSDIGKSDFQYQLIIFRYR